METPGRPERPHPALRVASAFAPNSAGQHSRGLPGGGGGRAWGLSSSMNEPACDRAPRISLAMSPRSQQSGRADPAPWRARSSGHSACTLQSAQRSWPASANGTGQG